MATEITPAPPRKRLSPAFLPIIVIAVVGLLISLALPRLILPRFSNQPTTLRFHVRVLDDQGVPIPDANVIVGTISGQTDLDGHGEVPREFPAKGLKGLTGKCRLEGNLRVEAPGYISWQASITDLFGRTYSYVDKGTNLAHEVTLYR